MSTGRICGVNQVDRVDQVDLIKNYIGCVLHLKDVYVLVLEVFIRVLDSWMQPFKVCIYQALRSRGFCCSGSVTLIKKGEGKK